MKILDLRNSVLKASIRKMAKGFVTATNSDQFVMIKYTL